MRHLRMESIRRIRAAAYDLGVRDDPMSGQEDPHGPEAASLRGAVAMEELIAGIDTTLTQQQLHELATLLESIQRIRDLTTSPVVLIV